MDDDEFIAQANSSIQQESRLLRSARQEQDGTEIRQATGLKWAKDIDLGNFKSERGRPLRALQIPRVGFETSIDLMDRALRRGTARSQQTPAKRKMTSRIYAETPYRFKPRDDEMKGSECICGS